MKNLALCILLISALVMAGDCSIDDGFVEIAFTRVNGTGSCQLRVSNEAMKTDGMILIESFGAITSLYCVNPGYYYIGCSKPAIVNVKYLTYNEDQDLTSAPYYKVLKLDYETEEWTTVPSGANKPDFDRSKPITGKPAYPADPTTKGSDFTCDQAGYLSYLRKWTPEMKCTSRDVNSEEFQKRLEYFIDSCEKIHDWNMRHKYRMEFTFYADWHPEEFEEITTTKQRYSGIKTPVPSVLETYNNSNYRYLMPSLDPCDDVFEATPAQNDNGQRRLEENTLREYICKPQNCSVTWAFAVTTSIEYAIKKLYLEEYDQIVEVALSAQELIDCVGKEHGVDGKVCDGLPLVWGFDYIFENGIAYRKFYHHTNVEGECQVIDDENKYHIAGYEKPVAYNKLGLFELVKRGPTAVTLGLDPEFFQYYRNDREEGPYFDTAFWRPSVYGVVVEYLQYAVEGEAEDADWPFFAIEARLRACYAFVFRLPIRKSIVDANIAGIAGFAIRPIVLDLLPTPEPPTMTPTPTPSGTPTPTATPTPTPTPTPEPWFPIYDPFILGDNCNFEKQTTCYWDVIKDDKVTELYLAVRDAYPTKALAHTRVLALSGMTSLSLELWHESLSKQVKNEAPIDTYFYSDVLLSRGLDVALIPRLMELLQYTHPSRLVFVYGTFKRDGFRSMLDWMVKNATLGYFKNLKYFQVSEHNIQASVNVGDAATLQAAIIADLKKICEDKVNFPLLEDINLDNNGYNEGGGTGISAFAQHLMQACHSSTGVKVSAWTNLGRPYTKMCHEVSDSYLYYDLEDERERAQCRFTWNWELKSGEREYAPNGPFPNSDNLQYCPTETPTPEAPTEEVTPTEEVVPTEASHDVPVTTN
ncbi:cysteine proteinase [Blastocystis sp. ATCC 50177/Nand II]|uniref:Cysteine proteinase n=1 Tax=Blastocystis sp. subtype 1 (strain ATCC 50177 / NandII) TaxID=478820 RepID=A0A196S735_BLAHN|nr:cysteine proteinase [Blastocystis sp. ATCC 50177/Nand II]